MSLNLKQSFRDELSVQIVAAFTVLIFSLSLAFSALTVFHQKKALIVELENTGKLLIKTLAYSCRIGVFSENPELLLAPVAGAFQHENVLEVSVFNTKGTPIFQQVAHGDAAVVKTRETGLTPPECLRYHGNPAWGMPVRIEDREDEMVFRSTVESAEDFNVSTALLGETAGESRKDKILGFLRLTLGKSAMKKQLSLILQRNLIIAACFLALGTLFTYIIARRITAPLKRLTEAAIASGEAGMLHPFPVESRNEIGNLAVAFNNLSIVLERRNAEKQLLEDKLWQSQKMEAIGTLAGGIAHDFNNILGIIMGFSEMALLAAPPESKCKEYLQEVFKASGRARELVNQILTFSRKGKAAGRPMQIGLIIKEALKMLRASLPSTIELRQRIQQNLPSIMADPTQIYQVLMNLCTNAGHAMRDKGGVLEVSLVPVIFDSQEAVPHPDLKPGKYQKLTVRDTGQGMEGAVLDRIFEPFYTTKEQGEGTGMGLAVVHGIIKAHDGAIMVQSEPGKGTCFDLFFPSLDRVATPNPEKSSPVPAGKERILLVDDEEPLVKVGEQMLASFGYRVTPKTSSLEALQVFKAAPDQFDLVITDLTMPKMTGLDLSRQILELRADMPIILCTGFSDTLKRNTAKSMGICELAMKPIVWKDLAQVIRRSLG
jgi:signal transduction histidine kinase/CheY-like chemotaxis protein